MKVSCHEAQCLRLPAALAAFNRDWYKHLCVLIVVFTVFAFSPMRAAAQGCITAGANWKSVPIGVAQRGTFITTFEATPSAAKMNSVIGLSHGAATGYASLAANVRFNSSGQIDARKGGSYAANSVIPYSAGVTYFFELDVNVATHRYSAFVTPPGGKRLAIGTDFAFRTEQSSVSSLDTWDVFAAAGSDTACNFRIVPPACPSLFAPPTPNATVGGPLGNSITLTDPVPVPTPMLGCAVPSMNFYQNGTQIANVSIVHPTVTLVGFAPGTYSFTAAFVTPQLVGPQSAATTATIPLSVCILGPEPAPQLQYPGGIRTLVGVVADPVVPGCGPISYNFYRNGVLAASNLSTPTLPVPIGGGPIFTASFTIAVVTAGGVGPQSPPTLVTFGDATPTPTPPNTNWNQFGFVPSGGRYNPYEFRLNTFTVKALSLNWAFPMNGLVGSSPTVADGVVYSGAGGSGSDFNLYALNADTGAKLWSFTTGGIVGSAPAVANGIVYFGSTDHNVYALNATTGTKLWSVPIDAASPLAIANGVVYFGAFDQKVYALNAASGAMLWTFTTSSAVQSTPAIANGIVYFGSRDHNVYALDAQTGAKLWSFATGNAVTYSSPAVVNGVVYIASADKNVYALNATTGAKLWSFTTFSLIGSSPAVANGVVYIGSTDTNFYALDANKGTELWSFKTGTGSCCFTSAAVANGVVYFGATDNNVYALDATTGATLWKFTTGREILSAPVVVNGSVYIGSDDSKLYAFH